MRIWIQHFQKIQDTDPHSDAQNAAFCEKTVKSSLAFDHLKCNVNTWFWIQQRCGSRSGSASKFRSNAKPVIL
jgi:hypothetical protein